MKAFTFTFLLMALNTCLFATAEKKQVKLRIQAQYGSIDQATIYFDYGVSPAFYSAEDGPKFMSSVAGVPNLYTLSSDNVKCDINGYSSLNNSAEIAIGLLIDSTAQYTFSIPQLYNFDSSTLFVLEDRRLNIFTEMRTNFYQVSLTPQDTTGRFFLHITKAIQFVIDTAGCSNNNGAISVTADSAIAWNTVSLLDSNNAVISSLNNARGIFTFNNLPEGIYKVVLSYNGYSTTKSVFVNGNYIIAGITASSQNVAVGQTIYFNSSTINTTGYIWQFGDSTTETGVANPTFFYYEPGTYIVTLLLTNAAGCSAQEQLIINVSPATGLYNNTYKGMTVINTGAKTLQVNLNDLIVDDADLLVYNLLGQQVYETMVTSNILQISLIKEPAGIYFVSIRNKGKAITAKTHIN